MLLQCFDNIEFSFHRKYLPCILWSKKRMSWLNSFDVRALIYHDCGVFNVLIKLSTIAHSQTRMECFATQAFGEEEVFGFHFWTLVYEPMLDMLSARGVYRKLVMVDISQRFHALATQLRKKFSCLNGKSHEVCWFQLELLVVCFRVTLLYFRMRFF